MRYFVTAIGTDSGKTLVSAILCEAFQADYWKPIQAGLPGDAAKIAELVSNEKTRIHAEAYVLKTPASPHAAAKIDNLEIRIEDLHVPESSRPLIIEGAGGCLVPLNESEFVIDIPTRLNIPVVVVSNIYLGSINHTLLTIEAVKRRNIEIIGIVFNGPENKETESIILHHTGLSCLLRIRQENIVDRETVNRYAKQLNGQHWKH
jgi:dethiobiotin synthetase